MMHHRELFVDSFYLYVINHLNFLLCFLCYVILFIYNKCISFVEQTGNELLIKTYIALTL